MGFWLFQEEVGLNDDGTFSGEHTVGDVLVLTDFTIGGKIGTVKVYEWVGDGSGTHDFFDFLCFQNEFAAGCL